ncbi:hypothetical protein NRZ30_02415 [Aeromonas jandaei]|uniref:hypothetical protein n=1 Tax=Aeromonas jandaei TaxID=650 RepID=UPI00227CFDE1|nr:hypothetical protein [Aeromonas jandaei]WAG07937.1 hypothetical protein NRZ30_02415 [Aeromonas jandaei]
MIQQIMPADGWFFRHPLVDGDYALYPLAAWGLSSEGKVVGLVAEATAAHGPTLKDVSKIKGSYVFRDQLLREDREHIMSGI